MHAQEIRIEPKGCDKGVRIVARNAQADDVVRELSKALGFLVSSDVDLKGRVNVDSVVPMSDVVSAVLPQQNVIISHRRDPDCPGRYRISRIWLLARVATPAKPAPHLPSIASIPVTPEAREQDELYQRAHGMLPPLDEPAAAGGNNK